jgi:hypothetical protein
MDNAEREDILLSLMRQAKLTGMGGKPADIAFHTGYPEERVQEILSTLVRSGEVTVSEDGRITSLRTGCRLRKPSCAGTGFWRRFFRRCLVWTMIWHMQRPAQWNTTPLMIPSTVFAALSEETVTVMFHVMVMHGDAHLKVSQIVRRAM